MYVCMYVWACVCVCFGELAKLCVATKIDANKTTCT
jgi:hypothetical protein